MATDLADLLAVAQQEAWNLAADLPSPPADWNRATRELLAGWELLTPVLQRVFGGQTTAPALPRLRRPQARTHNFGEPHPRIVRIAQLITVAADEYYSSPQLMAEFGVFRDSVAGIGEAVVRLTIAAQDRAMSEKLTRPITRTALERALTSLSTSYLPGTRSDAIPVRPIFEPDEPRLGAAVQRWQNAVEQDRAASGAAVSPIVLQAIAVDATLLLRALAGLREPALLTPQVSDALSRSDTAWADAARGWSLARGGARISPELQRSSRELRAASSPSSGDVRYDVTQVALSLASVAEFYRASVREAFVTGAILLPAPYVAKQTPLPPPSLRTAANRKGYVPARLPLDFVKRTLGQSAQVHRYARAAASVVQLAYQQPATARPPQPTNRYDTPRLRSPNRGLRL